MDKKAITMSLRRKITLDIVLVILFLGLTMTFVVTQILSSSLRREITQRGVSLAMSISNLSTDLILTENLLELKGLADEEKGRGFSYRIKGSKSII